MTETVERVAKTVSSWKALVVAAAALVAFGATTAGRYALARDLASHEAEELGARHAIETTVSGHERVLLYIHDDLERVLDQEQANARAVGAPLVPRGHQ